MSYLDASLPVEQRVDDLVGRMTLPEKVAQLGGAWMSALVDGGGFSEARASAVIGDGIGHVTRVSGETGLRPAGTAAFANAVQRFLAEDTRLGIPAIIHEESTAGFSARDATQFPQAIGLASTWDPDLVEEAAGVIRRQMTAVGARQSLAPVLDIARDPRWGRLEETYGEDPYLTARLGVAYVRGLQGDLRTGVAATGKHFVGYGLSEGGRNHGPVHLGPRELREVFAAPFAAAIAEAGLATVMNAYNSVDGLPCGASRQILDDLLRGELGFDGVVVADYFTTAMLVQHHRVAAGREDAARLASEAGLDVELPDLGAYPRLVGLVERGELDEGLVDRSVRRALRLKFDLGLFEDPYVDADAAAAAFDTPADRALARRLAERSLVLLTNDGTLPVDPAGVRVLAVVGPGADDPRLHLGDYHYPAHQEISFGRDGPEADLLPTAGGAFAPGPYSVEMVSVVGALRAALPGVDVRHARGCGVSDGTDAELADAVEAVRGADVAVVVAAGRSGLTVESTSGEFRDATDLGLPGRQQELLEAAVATGTPVVVVVLSGRAHALTWAAEHAAAVLLAWLPGEEGGPAVADVLLGRVSPSGRLPVTLARNAGQLPVHYNHRAGGMRSQMYGDYVDSRVAPLFSFGHGLTYASVEYRDLEVAPAQPTTADVVEVACTVANTGDAAVEEVVQLYVRDEVAPVARPVKQLAGFRRVALDPGASVRVTFAVEPRQLGFHDGDLRFVVEPGEVVLMVGASADDVRLEQRVDVGGPVREIRPW